MENKIGTLSEHSLHKYIKNYLADKAYQEIKIGSRYADVYKDNIIYEVQTRSFNNLRDKLDFYLPNYQVEIIYPICINKYIYLYNDLGEVIKEFKSPKHENPFKIFIELYKIKSYLKNPNLRFRVISLNIIEERKEKERKNYHQQAYTRLNQTPKELVDDIPLYNKESIIKLFDSSLINFTTKDFARKYHYTINKASTILNVLFYLDILDRVKGGRKYIYNIKKTKKE